MDWTSVVSKVFNSVAYDSGKHQLYLRFHSGKVYRYFDFLEDQYDEFLAAESKGKYFADHIREKFRYEEVRDLTYSSGN